MPFLKPFLLFNSAQKSRAYFRALRWEGKRYCFKCQNKRKIYRLKDGRLECSRCHFRFGEFTGTYLESINIPFNELSHLLYLFVLGVPGSAAKDPVNEAGELKENRLYLECINVMARSSPFR